MKNTGFFNIQFLDEVEQNIVIYHWRADLHITVEVRITIRNSIRLDSTLRSSWTRDQKGNDQSFSALSECIPLKKGLMTFMKARKVDFVMEYD